MSTRTSVRRRRTFNLVTGPIPNATPQWRAQTLERVDGHAKLSVGQGDDRLQAISRALGRYRTYFGSDIVERDCCVAEHRGDSIRLALDGEFLQLVH